MATVINLMDLTNGAVVNQNWSGTGVFDVLINAVNSNLDIQYTKGRITGSDYAQAYVGAMQAVLAQAVQWTLQADTNAAQTDDILTTTAIKLRDIAEKEATGVKQRALLATQEQVEQYKVNNLLPKELEQANAQISDITTTTAIKLRDIAEKEATGIKQREVMTSQKALYDRQKESFDDNKYQKLLEAQLNYNSMVFQDANPDILGISLENKVNDVYNKIIANLPLTPAPE